MKGVKNSERAKVLCGNFVGGEWRIAVQCSIGKDVTKVSIITVPGNAVGREGAIEFAKEKALYPNLSPAGVGVKVMASCIASDAIPTGAK